MKKQIAFLLAAQMALVSLASCKTDEPAETKKQETPPVSETNAPAETFADTSDDSTTPAETEFDRLSVDDGLPEMNFGGRDFRFMVGDKDAYQLYAEEYTGDALNDVIYERNQRVENRYDVKITTMSTLGMQADDYLVTYAQIGEHVVEVCAFMQYKGNTPAIYYCWGNWVDIPYLNFDQPWWNKEAIENHMLNGICYGIAGDLSLTAMQTAWCMPFNMNLMEDWGYTSDYLYNLVWDGEWTLDKLIEICSDLWVDVDGNNERNIGDKFGYGSDIANREAGEEGGYTLWGTNTGVPWITCLGERAITVGEDRRSLTVTLGTEKMYRALEKLVHFHNATVGVDKCANVDDFVAGNIGISTGMLDYCYTHFNDLDFSYGILPMPKYDTLQEKYITTPDYTFTMFGIPITLPEEDYEFVGIIMEMMNAESWKTVYPAYYEEALKGRYATDPNMAKMVDLITESRTYEYDVMCAQSLGRGMLPRLINWHIADNDVDLASRLAETDHATRRSLAEILLLCFDIEDESGILGANYDTPDAKFGE